MSADLNTILGLTREVLSRAEQGAWAEAAEIDGRRREQLQIFCSSLQPSGTPPAVIAALQDILKLNDELIGAVEHAKRAIVREADTVKIGKQAVAAYR